MPARAWGFKSPPRHWTNLLVRAIIGSQRLLTTQSGSETVRVCETSTKGSLQGPVVSSATPRRGQWPTPNEEGVLGRRVQAAGKWFYALDVQRAPVLPGQRAGAGVPSDPLCGQAPLGVGGEPDVQPGALRQDQIDVALRRIPL